MLEKCSVRAMNSLIGDVLMHYRITLTTGREIEIEDSRTLEALSSQICEFGYLITKRLNIGYGIGGGEITLFERGVASIQPA